MKQVGRKAASILLTLCMLLTMLPVSALAAASQDCSGGDSCMHEAAIGTTHYDTIGEAIDAANGMSGSDTITVTLLKNATMTGGRTNGYYTTKDITRDITLDLGGHTLEYAKNGGFLVNPGCHFTVQNGTYINTSTDSWAQAITGSHYNSTSTGATITVASDAVIQAVIGVCADGYTTLNVYGMIESTKDGVYVAGPKNDVTLDGAKIEAGVYGVYQQGNGGGSSYDIKNSTITTPDTKGSCAVFITNSKESAENSAEGMQTLIIENSVISGQDGIEVRYTNVTISGDWTEVTSAEDGYALGVTHNGSESAVGTLSITGGSFKGGIWVMDSQDNNTTFAISGGNFSFAIPEEYCAGGFAPVNNGDGTWSVKEKEETPPEPTGVAQIGDQTYPTLEKAFGAVGSDAVTIKLLADTQISNAIEVAAGENIVLDLNGCAVTVPAAGSDGRSLYALNNYGTLTIKDTSGSGEGSITARGMQNLGSGVLTIESGTFVSCDANGGAAVWNEATAYINGGTFRTRHVGSAGDNYGPGCLNNSGTAVITAGTFESVNKRTYAVISTDTITITPAEGKEVIVSGAHGGLGVDSGDAVVNGGSFSSTEYYGLYVSNDGMGADPMKAAVTVNGGTFTGANYSVWIGSDYNNPVNSSIEIYNGTFKKPLNAQENTREGAVKVYGGTFHHEVPREYCADGFVPKQNNDGTWGVVTETTYVAQIGETKYATLIAAIEAAGENATITLLTDVTEDVVVPAGKNITLDLNEHKITNVADHTITVKIGATLAITDTGTVDNVTHAKAAIWNEGTVTLNGGAYTRSQETGTGPDVSGTNSYYNIVNHGTMTINSGVSVTQNGGFSSMIENGYYSYSSGNASSGHVADVNAVNPELTINGGTFSGGLNTVKNDDGGKLTINGGTFTNTTQATVLNWNIATIAGGNFTAASGNCLLNGAFSTSASAQDLGQMTITGGSFTSPAGTACIVNYLTDSKPQISGGTFSTKIPEDFCAEGFVPKQNENGTWGVVAETTYVAQIGENKYATLSEAITAAQNGETVKLIANVTMQDGILLDKGADIAITLDLNGFTYTVQEGANVNNRGFKINSGRLNVIDSNEAKTGEMVAVGSGTTSADGAGAYGVFRVEANGHLNVTDVTLRNSRPWGLNVKICGGTATLTDVEIISSYGGGIEVTEANLGEQSQKGQATMINCTVTQTGYFDHCSSAVSVSGGSKLIVNGGTYTSDGVAIYVFSSGGEIEVIDGTFSGEKQVIRAEIDTSTYPEYTGDVQIKGGSYTGNLAITSPASLAISGGTFSVEISEEYCAEGYVPEYDAESETWGVAKKNEAEINGTQYATLSEALNAVKGGETIKVLAPATVDMAETYAITGKAITLDLNGQTVTWNSSAKNMIEIGADGGLTIQDKTDTGVLHFIGTGITSYGSGINTSGNGSLSLTGGTVLYEHNKPGYGLNIGGSSTFTMTGGTVKIAGAVNYAVRLASTSQCQLNGGQILFDGATTASILYGVYAVLYSSAGEAAGFSLGNLTVDGSMVPDTKTVVCVYGYNDGTPVTISGGTYTANSKSDSYAVGGGNSNATSISGGTFNGAVKAAIGKVTGGQFSVQPSAAYLSEGKIYEMQSDGYYHVVDGTYVARLGTVGYTSWDALWQDVSESTTASAVYILADVEEITVPEGENVTFYNSGRCTIGKITNNGTCKIISHAMTGTEVVNNGSLNLGHEVKSLVNNQGATMVATSYTYAKVTDSITNSGTMTISKGTYPCTITNTGTITLTGGSFVQKVTDWCATGYTTQKSGDLWVVVKDGDHVAEIDGYWYTSLSAAINAAQDGDTVKLLMDTTIMPTDGILEGLRTHITINDDITLDLNGKTISWDQSKASEKFTSTPVMFTIISGANVTITGNGTIDAELGSNSAYGINMSAASSNKLTIENGTFKGAPTAVQVKYGSLTILNGTFELAKTAAENNPDQARYVVNAIDANWKDGSANISIQGGSFCFNPSDNPEGEGSSYVAEGFKAVKNEDGSFEIAKIKVAEVGSVQYVTLEEAIKKAQSGQTVELLANATVLERIAITDKNITIDTNGYSVIYSGDADHKSAIIDLEGKAQVVVTGNGTFTFNDAYLDYNGFGYIFRLYDNSVLTIENGTYYAGLTCVQVGDSSAAYIKDGHFSASTDWKDTWWVLNRIDNNNSKFYVSGGTFVNYDPTNSDTESPADNFCTPEYAATPTKDESGNTIYTVVEAEARIGETGYVTLADAIAAAGDNDTITLLADVTEDVVVPAGKNITLDLYGHKITNDSDHTIVNNGTLTITDNSEAKTGTVDNVTHGKGALVNNGTVKLSGGTFERSLEAGTLADANGNSWYTIVNDGTMIIENGVTVKNKGGFSSMICNSKSGVMGNLTIDGGTFDGGINTVKNDVNSTLTINGGTFTNSAQYVIMNWNRATINDGTFATKDTAYAVLFTSSWQNASTSVGELVITGGTFTTATEEQKLIVDRYDADNIGTASISGGTFSEKPDDTYLVDGYAPEQNDEGDWVVVEEDFVAEIVDSQKYESLIDAVNAAKVSGQTVKLLADVELQPVAGQDYALLIDAGQSMTLDLNGHKITADLTNTAEFNLIEVWGKLTITDDSEGQKGSIEVTENGSHDSARTSILYNGYDTGKFTLEAGTLKLTGGEGSKKPLYGVYSSGTTVVMNGGAIEVSRLNSDSEYSESWDVYGIYNSSGCQTTVNGGTITVENQGLYNSAYGIFNASGTVSIHGTPETPYIEANAFNTGIYYNHTLYGKITLYGGKYNMQTDTATGWIEGENNITIAEGYEKKFNGNRTVSIVKSPVAQIGSTKYDTLADAVAAVKSGETIQLLADVTDGSGIIVPSGSNFTIDFGGHTYTVTNNLAGSTGTKSQCFQLLKGSTVTMQNGTIEANDSGITMIIQNYANLTLDDMTLDATQGKNSVSYVMSNNCGNVTITGDTNITAKEGKVAFDVYYWPSGSYVEGVTVTVDENMTGTITGKVEYGSDDSPAGKENVAENAHLYIEAGTFDGQIVTQHLDTDEEHGISISGGSFSEQPNKDYLAPYYEATQNTTGDNYWTVDVAASIEAIWIKTDATTEAGMLSELLGQAESGTVQLLKDVTTTAPVYVNEGVTLDLAGKALTANALITFGGYVKDSTEGTGLLKVGVTQNTPNVMLEENNPSLFIYDSEAAGYRLYSYTFEKLRAYPKDQTGDSMGFYFRLTFENLAAWSELNTAETTHGVVMSTVLELPDNKEMKVYFDQSTIQGVAGSILDGDAQTGKGFWLTVTGLNKLESGQTLTVTPTLEAVSGKLVINTEAFQYSKTAGENN